MNSRFRRNYNQKNYRRDQEAMQERFSQPRQGNYRVDRAGHPIMNQANPIDDRDYFDRAKEDNQNSSSPKYTDFKATDYQRRQSVWHARNNQPQSQYSTSPRRPANYRIDQRRTGSPVAKASQQPSRLAKNCYYRWQEQRGQKYSKSNKMTPPRYPLPQNRLQLLAVFVLLFFGYLVTGWQLIPMRRLNQLSVSGNHYINQDAILKSSRLDPLDQYATVLQQKSAIEAKIKEEIPMIEQVDFQRDSWQNLNLKVVEYDMVALMNLEGRQVPVLSNGELLMDASEQALVHSMGQNLPLLVNFDQKGKVVDLTNNALRNISPELLNQISEIELSTEPEKPNTIYVKMADGNRVVAIINTFSQKMKYYPQMVEQVEGQRGTFNLEVGAYFIPDSSANSVKLDNN